MSQTYVSAALRRLVRERSHDCCEYCLIPEAMSFAPHWIDHIVAEKHGGKTEPENLANSCILCNQCKGSDLTSIDPETGQITALFHPRRDRWPEHFQLVEGRIEARTPVGRVTVKLLQLNQPDRLEERKQMAAAGLLPAPT
jgi:hypothetical protein